MALPRGPKLYKHVCPGCNKIEKQPGGSTVVQHRCPVKNKMLIFEKVD